ncbi:GNAT family N-acetyltransferase [Arthrobacter sp. H14]|uniref:GNAT family N-acetyltransferase n=1 Tax=Arthrobacter sp. H14 TaxID=1312959 RepID=UPI003FA47AF7
MSPRAGCPQPFSSPKPKDNWSDESRSGIASTTSSFRSGVISAMRSGPGFRRKGYGRQILQRSLDVARGLGIGQALVTCDVDNLGSIRIIESAGALLEDPEAPGNGTPLKHRYWIAT